MKDKQSDKGLILLVDDVPVNVLMLKEILTREGYTVVEANDAAQMFAQLEKQLPDLILLDVMLPDQSGFSICKQLKADEKTRDIPVIFLTAMVEVKDKLEGFKAGAVDYVTKPFNGIEILARVKTHIQLKESSDLIKEYNEQLEGLLERRTKELIRSERQAAFSQMLQGIVHNLRNPISNIIGSTNMLLMKQEAIDKALGEGPESEALSNWIWKYVDVIRRGETKIETMVNNMMIKSSSDKSDKIEKVDLNDILLQELDFYAADLNIKNKIEKRVDLNPKPLMLEVVPSEIAQIFSNLYKNAAEAMYEKEKGFMEICSGKTGKFAWFSVEDNGPGIPQQYVNKIFDPFFSSKPSKRKAGENGPIGTGLGLHYCKETSRSYGGKLEVETQPEKGTKFTVFLLWCT
ncbi:MAG: hybrid sensor histidine kinase/response regulator [bacterium]|nr:hybrid sensor histidine kinase/response regulator [bacterium]